jgi:hypothetical protein
MKRLVSLVMVLALLGFCAKAYALDPQSGTIDTTITVGSVWALELSDTAINIDTSISPPEYGMVTANVKNNADAGAWTIDIEVATIQGPEVMLAEHVTIYGSADEELGDFSDRYDPEDNGSVPLSEHQHPQYDVRERFFTANVNQTDSSGLPVSLVLYCVPGDEQAGEYTGQITLTLEPSI